MNSHNSGSSAPLRGSAVTSCSGTNMTAVSVTAAGGEPMMSKGLSGALMPLSSNSVIQMPPVNSQSVVASPQSVSQATGATVALVRPPMQTAGSGTVNGNNKASPAVVANATGQIGINIQTPLVNNSQTPNPASVTAGPHIIKAEPPTTIIQSAPQPAVVPGAVTAPRAPVTVAGGIRALPPQMLAPRLPAASPGQPSIGLHNIQLPPGE